MPEEAQIPREIGELLLQAQRLGDEGHRPQAIELYRRVLARYPHLPDVWYNLARRQRQEGAHEAALQSYAQALARGANAPEEVHLNRAVIFTDELRQDERAEIELRAALKANPAYLPAWQNLANLQEDLGRREEARASYEQILEREPHAFEALARYSRLFSVTSPADPLIARLRAAHASARAAADVAGRASLGFALARVLDASGQYPEAFAAAARANADSRASLTPPAHYDRTAQERLVDELIRAFPEPQRRVQTPSAGPQPIFICGMFRSGSTLTEQLLAGHPAVAAGGELDLLPQLVRRNLRPFPQALRLVADPTLARLAAHYRGELARLFPQAAQVTDKRPDNFIYLGLIKLLFPQARIIHTTRNPLDMGLSIFFLHLDQRLAYALDLADIGHYFGQYQRLMAHWRALYGEDILDFNYDTLVRDPRPAVGRLLEFCDLEWHEACLEFGQRGGVKTASVWQVREGLYLHASGRAAHYARELAPLAAELSKVPDYR